MSSSALPFFNSRSNDGFSIYVIDTYVGGRVFALSRGKAGFVTRIAVSKSGYADYYSNDGKDGDGMGCRLSELRMAQGAWLLVLAFAPSGALPAASAKTPDLGPNAVVFSPATPAAEIQGQIDKVYAAQQRSEFG